MPAKMSANWKILQSLRRQHPATAISYQQGSAREWSKAVIRAQAGVSQGLPRNAAVLDVIAARFPGFTWRLVSEPREKMVGGKKVVIQRAWVRYSGYPTIDGRQLALADLLIIPPELTDDYAGRLWRAGLSVPGEGSGVSVNAPEDASSRPHPGVSTPSPRRKHFYLA